MKPTTNSLSGSPPATSIVNRQVGGRGDQMVRKMNNMKTELASLGSAARNASFPTVHLTAVSTSRPRLVSHLAILLAMVMSAIGLITITSTTAYATVTVTTQVLRSADRAAAPGEFNVVSLAATKGELSRLTQINRVASQKAEVRLVRNELVAFARKQIGDPYRAGRAGPDAFDCSGLVRYVFKQITGKTLPHYSKSQYNQVQKIRKSDAQPGDLVFFFKNGAHHVGIYIGNGKMIDAPNAGERVGISPITGSWWGRSYTGMGRLLKA